MPSGLTPATTINQVTNSQPNNPNQGAAVSGTGTAAQSAPVASFGRSGRFHTEIGPTQTLLGTSWAASFGQSYEVPTYGFLSMLVLDMVLQSGAQGSATVVQPSPDAPWDLFSNINIKDVNGTSMWNLDGFASQMAFKFGGYRQFFNDGSRYGYTAVDATTGGGAGTGNAKFKYQFPFEFGRDGMGCLPNMDNSATYRVEVTYNAPSIFYNGSTQQPGTLPNILGNLELWARNKPSSTDAYGNPQSTQPPALGTIQNWTSQILQVVNGQNTLYLKRTGNMIRNHFFIFRDSNGSRSAADSTGVTPTIIEFDVDAGRRYKMNVDTQRQFCYQWYNGTDIPVGCIFFPNTIDPDYSAGAEYGAMWLPTTGATKLELDFTSSAAGTLQVITNDIIPASGAVYSSASMAIMV